MERKNQREKNLNGTKLNKKTECKNLQQKLNETKKSLKRVRGAQKPPHFESYIRTHPHKHTENKKKNESKNIS